MTSTDSQLPADSKSRVDSQYIDEVVSAALEKLPADPQKEAFAKAMIMSVNLGKNGHNPCSPQQIQAECGFALEVQKDLGIILNKGNAIGFLKGFGLTVKDSAFKKKFTSAAYELRFGRQTPVINKRNLVSTYAEWLHWNDFLFEPKLPKSLIDLLPPDWEAPIGEGSSIPEDAVIIEINLIGDVSDDLPENVISKLKEVLRTFKLGIDLQYPPEKSSFFQKMVSYCLNKALPEDFSEKLKGFLTAAIEKQDATDKGIVAATRLIGTLDNIDNACIRIGNIVVVKVAESEQVTLVAEIISESLQSQLQDDPLILRNPKTVLDALRE